MAQPNQQRRIHYIHDLNYTTQERVVGIFVLAAMAVILALILVNGRTRHLFERHVVYHAVLKNAQGVTTESVVKVSGIEVGRVSSIDISNDNRVRLTFYVYKRYRKLIRTDSKASLSKLSILGKASIDIEPGSSSAPLLPDGATLTIEEPLSLDELMAELTPVMANVKQIVEGLSVLVRAVNPDDIRTTSHELAQTMTGMRAISQQIASGKGAVGKAVFDAQGGKDLVQSLTNLNAMLRNANQRLAEMKPVIANATAISADGRNMTKQLSALTAETTQLVEQMNTAMGTVNVELRQLPELMSRMKALMDSTDRTLQGMQRIWPLSSALPPQHQQTEIKARPANE